MEHDDGRILGLPGSCSGLTNDRLDFSVGVAASHRGNRNLNCLLRVRRGGGDHDGCQNR
jgi:hypothetical protein